MRLCRENLKEMQDPMFLWSLVTGDELWFSVLEPEQKQQSLQWVNKKAKRPKKVLRSRQARKTMMEVFFDDQGGDPLGISTTKDDCDLEGLHWNFGLFEGSHQEEETNTLA